MANPFFDHPILNSPYDCPKRHWELDAQGQPTQQIIANRRRAEFITPISKPKKRGKACGELRSRARAQPAGNLIYSGTANYHRSREPLHTPERYAQTHK
jgi:uncharacterized protein (DUF2126 family)